MIAITEKGVNFCTCKVCDTSFFFDKEDIGGSAYPYVECPYCSHKMFVRLDKDYFKHIDRSKKPHKEETK